MPPVMTRLCSMDLWQLRSQRAIWSRATAAMKMTRFDIEVPLVTLVGAMRAEHARRSTARARPSGRCDPAASRGCRR